MPDASLYIHVPFCGGICDYCDFYSVPVKKDDPVLDSYVDQLLEDGKALFSTYAVETVPTLYVGGGTPSVLGAKRTIRLLKGLLSLCPAGKPRELTVEANPESADEAFLSAAREAGANRLSLGAQTFHEPSRQAIRRTGKGTLLPKRLKLAAEYFPRAFSVDLMSGLPYQNEETTLHDIERVLEYEPAHVSLYALSIARGTPFYDSVKNGKVKTIEAGEADRLWIHGRDQLEKNGYTQYEVSNFCLPGKECLHNTRYWRMENWLALGPAASATIINEEEGPPARGFRYTINPGLESWLQRRPGDPRSNAPPPQTEERLDSQTLIEESLLMGFRLSTGPDTELFARRFGKSIRETIPHTLAHWQERGLLRQEKNPQGKGITALTKEGLLYLNRFLVEAFEELGRSDRI